MNCLEKRILKNGIVKNANVLKVENYNVYLPYYYFNEEKDKTLTLN